MAGEDKVEVGSWIRFTTEDGAEQEGEVVEVLSRVPNGFPGGARIRLGDNTTELDVPHARLGDRIDQGH
jgi:hypothetical protein